MQNDGATKSRHLLLRRLPVSLVFANFLLERQVNFHNLKSVIATQKTTFQMRVPTDSFRLAPKRERPYIQPTFTKVAFDTEKPAVVLISAVGATGKSALAQILSNETGLPLLDLARHKPVGDNTLTGLLTTAFPVEDLSGIFDGIRRGTYGIIIDGIDEGRSKTNDKAFEAFLDDIVRLGGTAPSTSFVLLGRTHILEDCWFYLSGKGTAAGLVTISPFDLERARDYIDEFTSGLSSGQEAQYREARDSILTKLAGVFTDGTETGGDGGFLSFIGYPPVLDAVVTLLQEEPNYHRIQIELENPDSNNVEINLLYRIASYILRREKELKVVPNIVQPLVADMPKQDKDRILAGVYEAEEQCLRLVGHCLERPLNLDQIPEPLINEKYEQQLVSWLPEHPFIMDHQFRNAVFEAVAIATLIVSDRSTALQLALDYLDSHKYNYHLVYLLDRISADGRIPISCLRALLGSALEFQSTSASVELHVDGPGVDDGVAAGTASRTVETQVEIIMGVDGSKSKTFAFRSDLAGITTVSLGQRLASTYVSLPCEVVLSGAQELELTAPVEVSAAKINLRSPALVLRHQPQLSPEEKHVLLESTSMDSTVGSIVTNGVELVLSVSDRAGLTYPSIQYVQKKQTLPTDPLLKEKYLRLKRILVHFRSHSRGSMAKYKNKVDNERVAGNDIGQAVLRQLLKDGILTLEGAFYFMHPENVDTHLGVSWQDLKKGRISDKLVQYLRVVGETG